MRLQAGIRIVIAFAIALIGITIAPVTASAAGGTISGTVVTPFFEAASGADILVDGELVTTTGTDGTFRTPPLTAGLRQVQARLEGFGPSAFTEVVVSDDTDQWISLLLGYPPGGISGVVTDADGVPFDGAEITVDGVAAAVSGPGGSFSTGEVAGGGRWVAASAPGYSQADNRFVFVSGPVAGVSLSVGWRDGTVSGVVTDVRGNAVGGASVLIDDVEAATSASDGSFTTGVVAGGWRSIVALAEGYASAGPGFVLVSGATTGVTAPAGYAPGIVSGIVSDGAGRLIAGADILIDGTLVTTSGTDGSFSTPVLTGGFRSLEAVAEGYVRGFPRNVLVSGDITDVVLSPGRAGGVVSGVVVDQDDQPVAGAAVSVDGDVVATSEADGSFVTGVVPGGFVTITASTQETFEGLSVFVTVDGDVSDVRVAIGRAAAVVTGVVRAPDGTPLAGIQYDAGWWGALGTTGDDGVYTLKLDAGQQQLRFVDPDVRFRPTTVDVDLAGPGTTTLDVTMQPVVENVIGTVTDAAGNPIRLAVVRLNGFSTSPPMSITDADGRFSFVDVPPYASYWIEVLAPFGSGLVPYTQTVAVVEGEILELDIVMDAAATVEVHVTADGGPATAQASLVRADDPFTPPVASGITDESGRIVLSHLQPGRYLLEIDSWMTGFADEFYPDSWYSGNALVIDVAAGAVLEFDADLERSALITGVVVGPDGQPELAADAIVQVVGSRTDLGRAAGFPCIDQVDGDPAGTYRKGCLHPSAQYIVSVSELPGVSAAQYYDGAATPDDATPVTVTEGGVTSGIDFRLETASPPVELLGLSRQFFRTGTSNPGVRLYGDNFPSDPAALVAEVVRFGFDDVVVDIEVTDVLSDQIAVVTVTVADANAALGARRLEAGRVGSPVRDFCDDCLFIGSAEVEVGAMSGRVTTAAGFPLPFAQVVLTAPDGRRRTVSAGPEGRWLATGLVPGAHRVTFLGTTRWAGEHWRNTTRVASARTITVTANRLRRGVDATLARRPAVSITSVSPAEVTAFGSTPIVLRGSGLAPIEGGFTVSFETQAVWFPIAGVTRERTGSSLWVQPSLSGGTYDVVVRWTDRRGTVHERRCDDCLTVTDPFAAP